MKILITGNLGYIGSVLTNEMKDKYELIGFDIGYFKDCILKETESSFKQVIKDINDIITKINELNRIFLIKRLILV